MDNNPNPYQFQGQNSQNQQGVPPPPPSPEAQIGVRNMQSDLESIRQSGGESPQSQIMSAPELSRPDQYSNPAPVQTPSPQPAPEMSAPEMGGTSPMSESAPSKFNLKTILIIVGGIIVAAGIGYGVYYLVSSLGQTPQVAVPQPQPSLPVAVPTTTPEVVTTTPPAPVVPVVVPLVHSSLILNPTKKETLTLADTSLISFEAALATSSKEKMIAGSVKDLAFVDASGTPIESSAVIGAYFAPQSFSLNPLFGRDFTSWLYYDKTGGAKLGMIFELNSSVAMAQASSTVQAALESIASNISSFFISNPPTPSDVTFKGGVVSGVPVRFLVYSAKNAEAFEYGWFTIGSKNYLVMGTSYNQMVDIIKRLKSIPVPVTSSANATSTATTSTTTTTTTVTP
jgi:hypothetical protein